MKKKKYLVGALAALMMVGCTDDITEGNGEIGTSIVGDGYVKVAINLPTENGSSTRSQNDQFDDGEKAEYEVKNGLIAFFQGVDEENAHFVKAYDLSTQLADWEAPDPETGRNVTTSKEVTLNEVPIPGNGMQTYALVVLNNNGLVTVDNNGGLTVNGASLSTVSTLYSSGLLTAIAKNVNDLKGTGFFMTNAPIATGPSQTSDWDVTAMTLAPVDVSTVEPSSADPIYVERAIAKVEVSVNKDILADEEVPEGIKVKVYETGTQYQKTNNFVTFTGWKLNITNKTTKLVRDIVGNNPQQPMYRYWASLFNADAIGKENRFFGLTSGPYRTYWAIDGNYSDKNHADGYQEDNFINVYDDQESISWNAMLDEENNTTKEYCLENTMNAENMMQGVTTGVLLEATYTVEDENYPDGDIFTLGTSNTIYGATDMLELINRVLVLHGSTNTYKFDRNGSDDTNTEGATINSTDLFAKFFQTENGDAMTKEDATILLNDTRVASINFYYGGRTYYWTKPIRHFGDYYTPLEGDNVASAKEYNDNDHLGRYGVVRNNWYQIEISSVSNPGLPEIPELPVDPEDPDDPAEGYVETEINVLSWAVRKQNVEL